MLKEIWKNLFKEDSDFIDLPRFVSSDGSLRKIDLFDKKNNYSYEISIPMLISEVSSEEEAKELQELFLMQHNKISSPDNYSLEKNILYYLYKYMEYIEKKCSEKKEIDTSCLIKY